MTQQTPQQRQQARQQHQEELEHNDLLDFFLNLRRFWDKYGTYVLGGVLLLVIFVTGYRMVQGREARANNDAWSELAMTGTPEAKAALAGAHIDSRPGLANQALLDAARTLFEQALIGTDIDNPMPANNTAPTEQQVELLNRAAKYYKQVIDNPQAAENVPPLHRVNARIGLGAVYEMLGQADDARQQYNLAKSESGTYSYLAAVADRAIEGMPNRAEPVVFHDLPDPVIEVLPEIESTPEAIDTPDTDVTP